MDRFHGLRYQVDEKSKNGREAVTSVHQRSIPHCKEMCGGATRREDNTGRDDHFMDGVQNSFHDLGYRRLSRMRVSMSLTSARSDCAVSGFVIRIVLCSATPHRNQRVERLMFRRQHKEKLGWNNTSVQPITIASSHGC